MYFLEYQAHVRAIEGGKNLTCLNFKHLLQVGSITWCIGSESNVEFLACKTSRQIPIRFVRFELLMSQLLRVRDLIVSIGNGALEIASAYSDSLKGFTGMSYKDHLLTIVSGARSSLLLDLYKHGIAWLASRRKKHT